MEEEPTPSRRSKGPKAWGGLFWGMCHMAAPPQRRHSWNRDLPVCPQADPGLPPEAARSPPFSGWQGPGTHTPQPAHLENGASGSNGPRGPRAGWLPWRRPWRREARIKGMRAWAVGGLPQQLPLSFQACGPHRGRPILLGSAPPPPAPGDTWPKMVEGQG